MPVKHGMARKGDLMEELLTVGQMAKLNGVSEKALRLYHSKGILSPIRIDEETGYRYYDLRQSATIDMIQQLRLLGFSLKEIADIVQARDVGQFSEAVRARLGEIKEQQQQLANARKVAEDLLSHSELYLHRPPCNQIILEYLPARPVLVFRNGNASELGGEDNLLAMDNWERCLRAIKGEILRRGWPVSLFRNVGCIIPHERLINRELRFESSFVFVDESFGDVYREAEFLPEGTYLTMYCDTAMTKTGADTETVMLRRMLDYAAHKNFEIAGDYIGEVIADTPAFLFEGREMFFKLCLPVNYADAVDREHPAAR